MIPSFNEGIIMDKSNEDAAIACTLNDAEFRERRALVRRTILPRIKSYQRCPNGLKLSFEASPDTRADVEEFIVLEQGCCGFLTFDLTPPSDALKLTITGPVGATTFIDMFIQFIEEAGTDAQTEA